VRAGSAVCVLVGLAAAAAAHGATLLEAVQSGDVAQVRAALAQGADANARDVDGATPLLYAAHLANAEIVRALLAAHADPNAANRYGVAPLHEAAQIAEPNLIRALLDAGAGPPRVARRNAADARGAHGRCRRREAPDRARRERGTWSALASRRR
jgi:ankyrin repeat protein